MCSFVIIGVLKTVCCFFKKRELHFSLEKDLVSQYNPSLLNHIISKRQTSDP